MHEVTSNHHHSELDCVALPTKLQGSKKILIYLMKCNGCPHILFYFCTDVPNDKSLNALLFPLHPSFLQFFFTFFWGTALLFQVWFLSFSLGKSVAQLLDWNNQQHVLLTKVVGLHFVVHTFFSLQSIVMSDFYSGLPIDVFLVVLKKTLTPKK